MDEQSRSCLPISFAPFQSFASLVSASEAEALIDLQDQSWRSLVDGQSSNRTRQWVMSRRALQNCFRAASVDVPLSSFKIIDHHTLVDQPGWIFSISHTDNFGLSWLVQKRSAQNIGVDVETEGRFISKNVIARFTHREDQIEDPLELWSIKEAIFKALPPRLQSSLAFTRIHVQRNRFTIEGTRAEGHWHQMREAGQLLSFAWQDAET